MWVTEMSFSVALLILGAFAAWAVYVGLFPRLQRKYALYWLAAGVFLSAAVLFFPIYKSEPDVGYVKAVLLSVFSSMQLFTLGCEFGVVQEGVIFGDINYQIWAALLFVVAPILTFGFVASLFKDVFSHLRYGILFRRDVYAFSEMNERSLYLAEDIRKNHPRAAIVFCDVFEEKEEQFYELNARAQKIGAICFKKDILVTNFKRHSDKKRISFFTIGEGETENLVQTLKLIDLYKTRPNVYIYAFSCGVEGEVLTAHVDKGTVKLRRINEVRSLISRELYENGKMLFDSATQTEGNKKISAVIVGMGNHGTEMVKALSWFGQMDGYDLEINAFDRDPLAEERFKTSAPELMDEAHNGCAVDGEAIYTIRIHGDADVESDAFAQKIGSITDASYVFVALGNDKMNINTAIRLRQRFEQMGLHPVIRAVVYNTQEKEALTDIKNYRGQSYDIGFVGDLKSSYSEAVILNSEVEAAALARHLKWGAEEEFWAFEYNLRSSMASAIHAKLKRDLGVPGIDKAPAARTEEERQALRRLEHRRWNAYMRSEGYVYGGTIEKSGRNDLAKKHNCLVPFDELPLKEQEKDDD